MANIKVILTSVIFILINLNLIYSIHSKRKIKRPNVFKVLNNRICGNKLFNVLRFRQLTNVVDDEDYNFGKLTLELAVFADQELRNRFTSDAGLKSFASILVYTSQIFYNRDNIRRHVAFKFTVVYFEIIDNKKVDTSDGHTSKYLDSFCNYQKSIRNAREDKWDAAVLFTGLNLWLPAKSDGKKTVSNVQIQGLAYENTLCSESSCSIVETRSLLGATTFAHELAHNFGIKHDGETEASKCAIDKYIMAEVIVKESTTEWSQCSVDLFRKTLIFMKNKGTIGCLENMANPVESVFDFSSHKPPGVQFNIDKQCHFTLGPNYHAINKEPYQNICDALYCESNNKWYILWINYALEGTFCGTKKDQNGKAIEHYCRSNECTNKLTPNNWS